MSNKPISEKVKGDETFGEATPGQLQSPLSFQLNAQGTPEHPCDLLPEYKDKPLMPIPWPTKRRMGGGQ